MCQIYSLRATLGNYPHISSKPRIQILVQIGFPAVMFPLVLHRAMSRSYFQIGNIWNFLFFFPLFYNLTGYLRYYYDFSKKLLLNTADRYLDNSYFVPFKLLTIGWNFIFACEALIGHI